MLLLRELRRQGRSRRVTRPLLFFLRRHQPSAYPHTNTQSFPLCFSLQPLLEEVQSFLSVERQLLRQDLRQGKVRLARPSARPLHEPLPASACIWCIFVEDWPCLGAACR